MIRCFFKLILGFLLLAGIVCYAWFGRGATDAAKSAKSKTAQSKIYSTRIWANPASLPDHFARHGHDFGAKDPDDYERMAYEFFQRAKREGLPCKVDNTGVYRVFDRRSGAFGAYNPDGTTKTFFKPGSPAYFDRQPGRAIDLKTLR